MARDHARARAAAASRRPLRRKRRSMRLPVCSLKQRAFAFANGAAQKTRARRWSRPQHKRVCAISSWRRRRRPSRAHLDLIVAEYQRRRSSPASCDSNFRQTKKRPRGRRGRNARAVCTSSSEEKQRRVRSEARDYAAARAPRSRRRLHDLCSHDSQPASHRQAVASTNRICDTKRLFSHSNRWVKAVGRRADDAHHGAGSVLTRLNTTDSERLGATCGKSTTRRANPWAISITLFGFHKVGGTLISPLHILTAAHSFARYDGSVAGACV